MTRNNTLTWLIKHMALSIGYIAFIGVEIKALSATSPHELEHTQFKSGRDSIRDEIGPMCTTLVKRLRKWDVDKYEERAQRTVLRERYSAVRVNLELRPIFQVTFKPKDGGDGEYEICLFSDTGELTMVLTYRSRGDSSGGGVPAFIDQTNMMKLMANEAKQNLSVTSIMRRSISNDTSNCALLLDFPELRVLGEHHVHYTGNYSDLLFSLAPNGRNTTEFIAFAAGMPPSEALKNISEVDVNATTVLESGFPKLEFSDVIIKLHRPIVFHYTEPVASK